MNRKTRHRRQVFPSEERRWRREIRGWQILTIIKQDLEAERNSRWTWWRPSLPCSLGLSLRFHSRTERSCTWPYLFCTWLPRTMCRLFLQPLQELLPEATKADYYFTPQECFLWIYSCKPQNQSWTYKEKTRSSPPLAIFVPNLQDSAYLKALHDAPRYTELRVPRTHSWSCLH